MEVTWHCRFHPTEWFHEVGCPHMEWTNEQLLDALVARKRFEEIVAKVSGKPLEFNPLMCQPRYDGEPWPEAVLRYMNALEQEAVQ